MGFSVNILWTDMSMEMQQIVKSLAKKFHEDVLEKTREQYEERYERRLAQFFKEHFDRRRATWHCVAGSHFAAQVTHEVTNLIYFEITYTRPSRHRSTQQHGASNQPLPPRQQQLKQAQQRMSEPSPKYWRVLLFKAA
eukprot:gnl/Trimastix_PCT/4637.p1 GENE.gnl/Trimastix_PCT/4637~~gnl/Trimastix_PCT/4637.p1  ORF type:complete len:138 (+),score=3.49 gnl/Trimastix_PCT/4637:89-502(+)